LKEAVADVVAEPLFGLGQFGGVPAIEFGGEVGSFLS
jgi:hypothetical protein